MDENVLLMAETLTQRMVEDGIKRATEALPKQPANFDGLCVECGDDIPAPRIKFGAITCVPCQTLLERRASLKMKP